VLIESMLYTSNMHQIVISAREPLSWVNCRASACLPAWSCPVWLWLRTCHTSRLMARGRSYGDLVCHKLPVNRCETCCPLKKPPACYSAACRPAMHESGNSSWQCPHVAGGTPPCLLHLPIPGARYHPFGQGSGERIQQDFGLPNLIKFPIIPDLSAAGDGESSRPGRAIGRSSGTDYSCGLNRFEQIWRAVKERWNGTA
jgi:hypothetical protein